MNSRASTVMAGFVLGLMLVPSKVLAQNQLSDALSNQESVSGVFNNLREITFESAQGNDLIVTVVRAGQWIGVALAGYYLVILVLDIAKGSRPWAVIGPFLAVLLVVQALMGSPGQTPRIIGLANGAWSLKDSLIQQLFQRSIAGVQINAAIEDNFKNVEAKNRLRRQLEACRQIAVVPVALPSRTRPKNPPEPLTAQQEAYYSQIECFERVQADVEKQIAQLEDKCAGQQCRGTRDNLAAAGTGLDRAIELDLSLATRSEDVERGLDNAVIGTRNADFELGPLSSDLIGSTLSNAVVWIALKVHQLWLFLLYWGYYLGVMASPIALLMSVTPILGQNPIAIWGRAYVLTMLTELWYVTAVGLSAVYQVSGTNGLDETFYTLFLGIGAPIIAVLAAGFSGFKASGSLGSVLAGASGGAVSVASTFLRHRPT